MRSVRVTLLFLLLGCAPLDRSILTRDGDEALDCAALKAEFDFAAELGENAPARRRHIRALQTEKQCVTLPKISISIGVSQFFN
ncbi:hypothetical protein OAH90_04920 [Alphaproteobacteria bacterium]|nr:hypothetical protein [Alphaproteobacteria bacterium]